MITIYCGEDTVAARSAFIQAVEKLRSQETEIIFLPASSVLEIQKGLADNFSLFSSQKVFCVENLEKYSFKKSTKARKDVVYEALVSISTDKSILLLDFEDGKQARQLKLKDLSKVYESKPIISIFSLLESCYPGNKLEFITSLRAVCISQDEMFILVMLFRHIRQLVLIANEVVSIKLPPWQKFKLMGQTKKWDKQKLTDFYSGLIKIEISSKTSTNPYGISRSLEILACHYL